ncbi:hypothetical protein LZ480_04635 [Solibacillus sp. MA9]|uniref:Uncharacterized protein n=1 Tax=Solibacillus palustris TaxID=2908203 RepID=A0ABS9UA31_9BACL|nr:hypothetical protein [Solibacillus sp. MA9]MCH7321171.1 hypothetical protein [Solibacillus sp. MA9]
MNKEQWDDENLENLFKQAPKVNDHRTKDEVLQRLIDEGAFDEKPPQLQKVAQKRIRWTPLIASIASLFILVLIGSQFIGNNSISMENSARDEAEMKSTSDAMEAKMADQSEESSLMTTRAFVNATTQQTLVYESQLEGVTLFEMGLSDGTESIPVSFLIPNEIVLNKVGTDHPTNLQLYETFASKIDETALGFSEYHPFIGTFREQEDGIIHTLPDGHNYDASSANISNYTGALINTFGDAYKEVQFENEHGEPLLFNHLGNLTELIQLQGEQRQYNYFVYQKQDGSYYLSPNFHTSFSTVEEALNNMGVESNDLYQSAILPDVAFNTEVKDNIVTITFDQPLDLEQFEPTAAMRMIEGMLLTAASFDKQIKFEHIVQDNWSGFDFTKPLEKPIAANIVLYNF